MVQRNALQASHFLLPQYFFNVKSIQWQAKLSSKEKEKNTEEGERLLNDLLLAQIFQALSLTLRPWFCKEEWLAKRLA
jgi:hypothetical protein